MKTMYILHITVAKNTVSCAIRLRRDDIDFEDDQTAVSSDNLRLLIFVARFEVDANQKH